MRVHMLEDVLHDGAKYHADDTITVSEAIGQYFCENGWAEDVAGGVATGERVPGAKTLSPEKVSTLIK